MNDAEFKLFRTGDPAFFRTLNRRHGGFIMSVVRSFNKDSDWAQELHHMVWIAVWKERKTLRERHSFTAWAGRIARNTCLMEIRARRRHDSPLTDVDDLSPQVDPVDPAADPLAQAEASQFMERVLEHLPSLPKAQRESFHLVHLEGYSANEAAEILGVAAATVRSNVRHAAKRLAKLLPEFRP